MKITEVQTFTVRVPTVPGSWHSPEFGDPGWDDETAVIVRFLTDEGLVGVGEVPRTIPEVTVRKYVPQVIGCDPLDLNLQSLPIGGEFDRASGVYEAFEMAIYDLVGKARGVPAYQLLGGAYRDRVLVSLCSGQMTPADAARLARKAVDRGYRYLKMKSTETDPLVERIAAINAEVGTDIRIVVDPMERFHRPVVLDEVCRRLEPYHDNIQCFEDPFDRLNLDWYVMMRQKVHFPLALMLTYPPRAIVQAIKAEACDYLNMGGGSA